MYLLPGFSISQASGVCQVQKLDSEAQGISANEVDTRARGGPCTIVSDLGYAP